MLLYLICRRLMRNRFPARLQYLLAKAAVLYYLFSGSMQPVHKSYFCIANQSDY